MKRVVGDVRGRAVEGKVEIPMRAGLGFVPFDSGNVIEGSKHRRQQIVEALRAEQNDAYLAKAVTLSVQGAWTRWSDFIKRDLSWRNVLCSKASLMKFCIGSTYDTLNTPNNLHRWGIIDDPKCTLCNQDGCSLLHILSACNVAFGQKRYTWRHNCVLRVIADGIQSFIGTYKIVSQGVKRVHFVVEGKGKEKKRRKPTFGFLHKSRDFKLDVDLDKKLKYPDHIAESDERPDIVLYSNQLKLVFHIELTCPGEERLHVSYDKKMLSYGPGSALHSKCLENGWKAFCFPVEVGVRGYANTSLGTCLKKLGIGKQKVRKIIRDAGDTALRCSFWLCVLRDQKEWTYSTGFRRTSTNVYDHSLFSKQPKAQMAWKKKDPKKNKQRKLPQDRRTVTKQSSSSVSTLDKNIVVQASKPSPDTRIVVQPPVDSRIVTTGFPSGFMNIGNSCYIGSVLQCVFNVLDFSMSDKFGTGKADVPQKSFLRLFQEWLLPRGRDLDPSEFKTNFISKHKEFANTKPQDAHEFFLALLAFLKKSDIGKQMKKFFKGHFCSILTCRNCNDKSAKFDPFSCIELELSGDQVGIDTLVNNFEKTEELEDSNICSNCNYISVFDKSMRIINISSWVVILLKRFKTVNGHTTKISNDVSFLCENFVLGGKAFDLHGLVCHKGSRKSGHYYSFILFQDKWCLCNDSQVTGASKDQVLSAKKDIYLAFYKLQSLETS